MPHENDLQKTHLRNKNKNSINRESENHLELDKTFSIIIERVSMKELDNLRISDV